MTDEPTRLALEGIRADLAALVTRVDALLAQAPPPIPPPGLKNPGAFFDVLRKSDVLGPTLTQAEVDGVNATLGACSLFIPRDRPAWPAYCLATDFHETGGTMQPVREVGRGKGKRYGLPGRNGGQVPYGRGKVQLTWDDNYERADRELDLGGALVANYDLALDMDLSARILVRGMMEGWFTGKRLRDYLPAVATRDQFKAARRIVNGTDRADLIAGYALTFQTAVQAGGWS